MILDSHLYVLHRLDGTERGLLYSSAKEDWENRLDEVKLPRPQLVTSIGSLSIQSSRRLRGQLSVSHFSFTTLICESV